MSNYPVYGHSEFIVCGTLESVPQCTYSQNGGVAWCEFVVIVTTRDTRNKVDVVKYIPVLLFDRVAENAEKYWKQGELLTVFGTFKHREWQDKDGNNRLSVSLVATKVIRNR